MGLLGRIAEGGTRTHTLLPERDFESRASANSATSAVSNSARSLTASILANHMVRVNRGAGGSEGGGRQESG